MAACRRKTLVVCRVCHEDIHYGASRSRQNSWPDAVTSLKSGSVGGRRKRTWSQAPRWRPTQRMSGLKRRGLETVSHRASPRICRAVCEERMGSWGPLEWARGVGVGPAGGRGACRATTRGQPNIRGLGTT
ncbi:hypothetical protein ABZ468_36795 [Streptomyces sp. NPDC005708]|uniref:hypothetical protein n=1 Tax=unclassified Streptomyces TaxID=2593676 RepID=UPI0033E3297C